MIRPARAGLMALASTKTPRKPCAATALAVSSAAAGEQVG
jgi:hypothetical protein